MFNAENAIKKWGPVLDHGSAPKIKDAYRRAVTATLLENQERAMKEERAHSLHEGTGAGDGRSGGGFDPILISLVRRAMPNLIAYDIAGVQPMSAPTGLIFALRSKYGATPASGAEALYGGRNAGLTAAAAAVTATAASVSTTVNAVGLFKVTFATTNLTGAAPAGSAVTGNGIPVGAFLAVPAASGDTSILISQAITGAVSGTITVTPSLTSPVSDTFSGPTNTATSEAAIDNQMGFQIEKTTVTAVTRALKAEYTMELAQDLKAVHGLDAESELANILSSEILLEINREVINKINAAAVLGAPSVLGVASGFTTAGVYSLSNITTGSTDGRWSVEKYKGLLIQIEKECNAIAKDTRRGKGNFIICSSNVASVLAASGVLDYAPAMSTNLEVDDTGNSFAGILNGRIKVYVDPYATSDYVTAGYRGTNPYDAGMFYAPYVPLTMVRAIDPATFQPRIAFKTRYGLVNNPFVTNDAVGGVAAHTNFYYRTFAVTQL